MPDSVELTERFREVHSRYYSYEWTWAHDAIGRFWGLDMDTITRAQAMDIVKQWKNAVVSLDKLIYDDAGKEFALTSMTGFGVDGDKAVRDDDFNAVRGGVFAENQFVHDVLDHIERKSALGDRMLQKLK